MCHDVTEGVIGVDFGKNGKAGVNPQADLGNLEVQEKIKLAAEMCPMQAIEIEED